MRIVTGLAAVAVLGACDVTQLQSFGAQIDTVNLVQATERAIDDTYRDKPFEAGTVYVVANEHGDLHTYSLTPCQNGTHICGGSGQVGHVQRTADYYIVTDAYRGRTFYLSPGGDGVLKWRGVDRDLAWN